MASDFTISDVLAWARTKPADEAYCYASNGHCALAQFLHDTGRAAKPVVDPYGWSDGPCGARHEYSYALNCAVQQFWAGCDHTFGSLVRRLEVLASRPDLVIAAEAKDLSFYTDFPDAVNAWKSAPSEWAKLDAYLTDIERVDA